MKDDCKRYLKQFITENVPGVIFVKPPTCNEAEIICSNNALQKAFKPLKNKRDDFNTIFEAAKMITGDVNKIENWNSEGNFEGLEKRVLFGPVLSANPTDELFGCL